MLHRYTYIIVYNLLALIALKALIALEALLVYLIQAVQIAIKFIFSK